MTAPCPNQIIDATTGRTPPPSRLSTPSSPSTSSIGDQDEQKLQSPTIDAKERKRQRDRERYASMSVEKRKDINKKRRGMHETVCHPPMPNSSRAAYANKWYRNLTPDVRESRRECLRLYNKTTRRKEAKRADNRRRRELRANTLNSESIPMENPTYTPEIVHPNSDATEPNGSPVSARDWAIPELSGTPFFPASTQTEDVGSPNRCTGRLRHKRHVPSGERQSLLARRNQQFETTVGRNLAAPIEGAAGVGGEGCDTIHQQMTTEVNINDPASEGLTSEQPLIEEPDDEPSQEQESQQQEDPPQAADFAPEEANLSEEGRQDYALPSKYFMV
ncbi:hypothetical protein U9M48_016889 [Paspalum notatum var. saurae]|uniref:Uncharacterized protein n=1 Tax=Paspalum notatum var. saurae TaxID=547442 RepID=A0AAQ3T6H0_PASNO